MFRCLVLIFEGLPCGLGSIEQCGTTGHELNAANVSELAARFEDVASMMEDSGLNEVL